MKDLMIKYIQEEVSKLKYKDDTVNLKGVYPSILEECLGNFDKPYELNGYDCDYTTTIGDYEINGCMRYGTAEITLTKGEEKSNPKKVKTKNMPISNTVDIGDISKEELKDLNTYYFTFGIGQRNEGCYQPIMAKTMQIAYNKMFDMYGTHWASNYTQEEWDEVLKNWGRLYEGKGLKPVIAL